jgi:amino acid transporter
MKPTSSARAGQLPRTLGPIMGTAVVIGTVIGSGVFKKPASIAANVPFFGLTALVWVLGGVLVLLGALAYAEVTTLLPRAGGNYVFLREGYGRLAGFLWGWVEFWIIRSASLAALATIFTESLGEVVGGWRIGAACAAVFPGFPAEVGPHLDFWGPRLLTVGVLVGLALINARGTHWGGGLQVFITVVKVTSLLAIASLPFLALLWLNAQSPARPDPARLTPTWPDDWTTISLGGLATAFLGVLWAYHGWMNIAPVAEEVDRPQRNLPLSLLGGVAVIVALYLGANLAYSLIIPRTEMAGLKDTTVAAEFGRRLFGPAGAMLAAAAVMCSVFGALNGNLLVGPRLLYAMGEDGLAPRALREVHPRYRTPARAILVLAGWAILLVLGEGLLTSVGILEAGKSAFDKLTDFAMFGAVIFETMAVVSVFVFRRTMPDAERPYRCIGYPVVPALYVVLPACVLVNMFINQRVEALVGVGFILLGVLVYFGLGLGSTGPAPTWPTPRPDRDDGRFEPIAPAGDGVRRQEERVM